jgi:hypothetical protein
MRQEGFAPQIGTVLKYFCLQINSVHTVIIFRFYDQDWTNVVSPVRWSPRNSLHETYNMQLVSFVYGPP